VKRRRATSRKPAKAQQTAKRGTAPKAARNRRLFALRKDPEIARLARERDEALEREKATAQVLHLISSSRGELIPIFEAILANAVRLCEAKFGFLYLFEAGAFRIVAAHDVPPGFSEARRRTLLHPPPGGPLAEVIKTKQAVQGFLSTESPRSLLRLTARWGGTR
jgi:hypothetical protein